MGAPTPVVPALERSFGRMNAGFRVRDGRTVLASLLQDGCLKARFPQQHSTNFKTGTLINTTGGIADGDILNVDVQVGEGCDVVLTSQAAERVYKAHNMLVPAQLETRLHVASGATLYWLPQETILFGGGAIERHYSLDLATTGRCLIAEMLVLGRVARGEVVETASLFDRWRVRVGGRLVFADGFRLTGPVAGVASTARLGEAKAVATVLFVAPDAADYTARLRDRLASVGCHAACSERSGVLIIRLAGASPLKVRDAVMAAIAVLDGDRGMAQPVLSRWIF